MPPTGALLPRIMLGIIGVNNRHNHSADKRESALFTQTLIG